MLNTKDLETKIKRRIKETISGLNLNKIVFEKATDNSKEGIYVFAEDDKYYFMFVEKGKTRERKELYAEEEVLWCVLDELVFEVAMRYAIENREKGVDFRKALFDKEIELFSRFGNDFKHRKVSEINEILRNNPYI